jgi:DNA-directed RNA polymerase specialized sigma54-like protein
VVRRLARRYPEASDSEIAALLERDFEYRVARRTIAYHRGRALPGGRSR